MFNWAVTTCDVFNAAFQSNGALWQISYLRERLKHVLNFFLSTLGVEPFGSFSHFRIFQFWKTVTFPPISTNFFGSKVDQDLFNSAIRTLLNVTTQKIFGELAIVHNCCRAFTLQVFFSFFPVVVWAVAAYIAPGSSIARIKFHQHIFLVNHIHSWDYTLVKGLVNKSTVYWKKDRNLNNAF